MALHKMKVQRHLPSWIKSTKMRFGYNNTQVTDTKYRVEKNKCLWTDDIEEWTWDESGWLNDDAQQRKTEKS